MPVHTNTPLYLYMQRSCIYIQSPYHMYHMYTLRPPFTHMHIKALSHMCTQEFHNHICVRDPCPNWCVRMDLS